MRLAHIWPLRPACFAALLAVALLGACARLPAEEARGTPAESVAAQGFAQLSATGMPVGSAVAIAPDRLLTNAHVVPAGIESLGFRRGDGAAGGTARLLARSDRMDLAVLEIPPGLMRPVAVAEAPPEAGQRLWALGAPSAGPAVAAGEVVRPAATLAGHGPGFTAQLGALLGYSGGPALDGQGRLLGLVTALPQPGAAPLLAALSGMDLDGLARGRAGREVFLLSIEAALAEAERIAPR
ncbi:MAG TPA: serine protease [Falsiroseomonas sp.]|jgi:S1-C subfamily serine protease|nr:serine protease [Falsiroseomonas sp.]